MEERERPNSPFVGLREIIQRTGRSKGFVYALLDAGVIPSRQYGKGKRRRRRLILRSEFERFLEGRSS